MESPPTESPRSRESVRGITVIIPTLDEIESIAATLATLPVSVDGLEVEWLVVDGGSVDGTVEEARRHGARVLLDTRGGYGSAYKKGIAGAQHDIIVTLDGDMSYPGERVLDLVELLERERLDFISCDRLEHMDRDAMSLVHRFGNALLTAVTNRLHGLRLRDSQSGMWVFRRPVLDGLRLTSDGFPFSQEIKIEAWRRGLRCREVAIPFRARTGRVKLDTWRDGLANLLFLFRKRSHFS